MTKTRAPRPGFVSDVDHNTPPLMFPHGEGFRVERLPVGRTRVVYPADPRPGLHDPNDAVRRALLEPLGSEPLPALLRPGMKLTIAFDDVSVPLPAMRAPDVRQRILEAVLDLAAEAGVDDVHLIAAIALRRRLTEAELRHVVGDRVYDAFAPHGLLYNHDAEDGDGMVVAATTPDGDDIRLNRRAAQSDLVVYVGVNAGPAGADHGSAVAGLGGYAPGRHIPRGSATDDPTPHAAVVAAGVNVFHIEATLNSNAFGSAGALAVLQKREHDWTPRDRAAFFALQTGLKVMSARARRKAFQQWRAPYEITSVHAGDLDAVRTVTDGLVAEQLVVPVQGQTDILTMGLPSISPYSVNSVMNPVLVMGLGLGHYFNLHRGRPLVREGGVLIMTHPTPWEFHPVHHPSSIDFFDEVLADTTDPAELAQRYEKRFADDEWYRHLYRTSYAHHGVHPFHVWYQGSHARQHLAQVIVVGGSPNAVHRLGFRPASTMADAFEMASDVVGRQPTVTHLHNPPAVIAEVS